MEQSQYAGFWKRFVAHLVDNLILGIASLIILLPAFGLFGVGLGLTALSDEPRNGLGLIIAAIGTWFFAILIVAIGGWLYYALMESSKGATLGKMVMNIHVVDMNGNRISFGRASGRYFGKILSYAICYVGFIMAGLTQQKQALHDIMAGCLVINK